MQNKQDRDPQFVPEIQRALDLLREVPPRNPEAAAHGRAAFTAELKAHFASEQVPWLHKILHISQKEKHNMNTRQKFTLSTALAVLLTLAFLLGSVGATTLAAQAALPGDALYLVKTGLEDTRVELARDPAFEADLHLQFAKRRLDEMIALIQDRRLDQLSKTVAEFQIHIDRSLQAAGRLAGSDPARAQQLNQEISTSLARYAQALSTLLAAAPDPARPAVQQALEASQRQQNGSMPAAGEQEITGTVEILESSRWVVAGLQITINPQTEIKGMIQVGDLVKVHASPGLDGILIAREIEPALAATSDDNSPGSGNDNTGNQNENEGFDDRGNGTENENEGFDDSGNHNSSETSQDDRHGRETRFTGVLQAVSGSQWTISGMMLIISPQTEIRDVLEVGDLVDVRATTAPDGSLLATRLELPEDTSVGSSSSGNTHENTAGTNPTENQNAGDDHGGQDNDDPADMNDDHGGGNENDDDSSGKGNGEHENDDDRGGNENGDDSSGRGG